MENLVAGQPTIDVEDLKRHTEYRGYAATAPVVTYFWRVLGSLSHADRSDFVRFVWGRSRLPLPGRPWPQTFRIDRSPGGDEELPKAHTCFFSLDLPEYSSEEVCRRRLVTVIEYGVGGILNS